MFLVAACRGCGPTTADSARVDFSDAELHRAEQVEAERLAREEEESARLQRAEEERLQQEAEEEMARQRLKEQRAEEEARLEHQRREKQERQAQLKEARERKEALDTFCRRNGFADIWTPRRTGCTLWSGTATYPLHLAAELADARVVEMLLKEGVHTAQKDSSGKTAAQVAQIKDRSGSHLTVQSLLGGATRHRSGGA